MNVTINNGVLEVHPSDLKNHLSEFELIDVRRPDEFVGELGHIDGARLVTLGPDLVQHLEKEDKNKKIVFICRSGGRSGQATLHSQSLGFKTVYNMTGGMLLWNELKLPVSR